jgi:hypothetical protein
LNDEPTTPAQACVGANEAAKPWVEPKLVKLQAGGAQVGVSGFYDGSSQSS